MSRRSQLGRVLRVYVDRYIVRIAVSDSSRRGRDPFSA